MNSRDTMAAFAWQYGDDVTWRTIRLDCDVPYATVASIFHAELTPPGATVAQTVRIYPLTHAFQLMTALSSRPLDAETMGAYRRSLGLADETPPPDLPPEAGERAAWRLLRALWAESIDWATLCADHMLMHARIGLFRPPPGMDAPALRAALDDYGRFRRDMVITPPDGLTRGETAA